ncbi:hypothetical protein JTB14_034677 [Gonioctena quinquepunctata]|nr:hypothetical protein JTB14_034677 [Gonioctena quinquepunctata]
MLLLHYNNELCLDAPIMIWFYHNKFGHLVQLELRLVHIPLLTVTYSDIIILSSSYGIGLTQEELENASEDVVRALANERENVLRKEPIFEFDNDENVSDIDTEEGITQNSYSSDSEQSAEELDEVSDDDEQSQLEDDCCFSYDAIMKHFG